MPKLVLLIPVLFAVGGGTTPITVEGSSPVPVGKQKLAYPLKCTSPITVTASGPTNLVVDVRGRTDVLGTPFQVELTRNEKSVSKNPVMLRKSKSAGKGFAGVSQLVVAVPEGVQKYVIGCDASSDIAMSFRVSKKSVKGPLAVAEVQVEPKVDPSKVAKADKTDKSEASPSDASSKEAPPKEAAAKTDGKAPAEATAAASGGAKDAYVGLFHTTVLAPTHF
jgi:hypothetical protein